MKLSGQASLPDNIEIMEKKTMRKSHWMAILAATAGLAYGSVMAANLSNGNGQTCGADPGTWHFVNNQTGGAGPGLLSALFSNPLYICNTGPTAVNKNTQHFYCSTTSGGLVDAITNLPGRLVLSDYECAKKPEPPKEPPKK